jgi:hypothetical protein
MKWLKWKFNKIETVILGLLGVGLSGAAAYGVNWSYQTLWVNRDIICFVKEDVTAHKLFEEIEDRWSDELKLTHNTSRMSLPSRIASMQAIRRELSDQKWPDCAAKAKESLTKSMDSTIEGFITFLDSDNPDFLVGFHIENGTKHMEMFHLYMQALKPESVKLRQRLREEVKRTGELERQDLERIIKDIENDASKV